MTDIVKQFAPQILKEIQNSKNILMHCHPSPDPDSVGSVLAMMHALKSMGKESTIIAGDSEKPISMSHLPGFDRILDKSWWEVNLSEYDLLIAMDSSSKDMISKEKEVIFPEGMKVIVIDHHISNLRYGDINLVEDSYPATGQIIYDLLKEWGVVISKDIAACLFLSIYYDSGGFRYRPADSSTFKMAAELVDLEPNFSKIVFEFENNNYPQRILFEGLALNNIKTYFNNTVAISELRYEQLEEKGIQEKHLANNDVANRLKSVIGWNLGISFVETKKDKVNIGFRTRDAGRFDVSKIAVALGGGGHKAASGASVKKSFDEAKKELLEAIQKIYPELGRP